MTKVTSVRQHFVKPCVIYLIQQIDILLWRQQHAFRRIILHDHLCACRFTSSNIFPASPRLKEEMGMVFSIALLIFINVTPFPALIISNMAQNIDKYISKYADEYAVVFCGLALIVQKFSFF